jgi:hypothetical protein
MASFGVVFLVGDSQSFGGAVLICADRVMFTCYGTLSTRFWPRFFVSVSLSSSPAPIDLSFLYKRVSAFASPGRPHFLSLFASLLRHPAGPALKSKFHIYSTSMQGIVNAYLFV